MFVCSACSGTQCSGTLCSDSVRHKTVFVRHLFSQFRIKQCSENCVREDSRTLRSGTQKNVNACSECSLPEVVYENVFGAVFGNAVFGAVF